MNTFMHKIFAFFRRFSKLVKMIDKETQVKGVLKSVFGALLISILILLLPVLVVVNMFIYTKLTFLLSIFLFIFILSWPFIYYLFYYKLLKVYYPKVQAINTTIPQLVESTIVAIFFLILGIIVLSVIF
jgi:hypothetical protein